MKRWLLALVPVAMIVVLLGYAIGSHVIPQSVQDNFANAATAPDTSNLPDDTVAGALPAAPVNAQIGEMIMDNAAAPAAENDTAPAVANDDTADAHDDPQAAAQQTRREIAATVRHATLAALDSGEPTHWHKDGVQGDIVVSVPQDDGQDGNCRTVTATIGNDDDRRQSGDHVWCQPADGSDWTPQ